LEQSSGFGVAKRADHSSAIVTFHVSSIKR
jgi:hypothetical protein